MIRRFLTQGAGSRALDVGAREHAGAVWASSGPGSRVRPRPSRQMDLTGYWVSIVTEDWRWRMVTPAKGDYTSVPLSQAGRKAADAWDPDKDIADGNQCKAYGAAAVMRVPGRVHITWTDDNTLKVETDAGTQTRTFHFNAKPPANEAPSWQGYSSGQLGRLEAPSSRRRCASSPADRSRLSPPT